MRVLLEKITGESTMAGCFLFTNYPTKHSRLDLCWSHYLVNWNCCAMHGVVPHSCRPPPECSFFECPGCRLVLCGSTMWFSYTSSASTWQRSRQYIDHLNWPSPVWNRCFSCCVDIWCIQDFVDLISGFVSSKVKVLLCRIIVEGFFGLQAFSLYKFPLADVIPLSVHV